MTEDEWNALTSAYSAMTEAQGPLQAEYLKRQNNPNFVGYIPENEMSSISPQYQDAMSNWLTYAKKYGIGDPSLIGSSETTGSSTGAYGTQNAQYANLLSPGNSPVTFQREEPTIPKINTRGYNVNPNVNMGQKQVIGQDPVTGRPLYSNVSTEQTTLQGGVDPTDASIMYDEQGNLLQPTTGGAVGGSGESFVFPEAKDIINNAYGGRRKNKKYSHGGPPPHPEDLDVVRNQSNKEVLSKQLTSLNNPNLIENTYVSEDTSDPYALFEKIRSASIQENAGNPSQLNTTFLTKAGVTPFNIRSEDYSGEITGSGEKQVYEKGNFNPYLSNNPFQGPTAGTGVPEPMPTFPYGGQPQQQGGQGDQIQQIIMAYAQISNQDPQTIMQQLEQSPPEQQQQIIQQMVMAVQEGGQGNVPQMGIGGTINQGIDAGVDLFGGDSNSALWKGISGGVGAIVDAYTGDYAGAAGQAGQVVSAVGSTSKNEDVQKATNIVETGTGLIDTFSNLKKPEGEIINESTVNPSGMPDLTNQDFFNTGYSELGAETGQPAFSLGQNYKQLPAAYGGRRRRATGGVEPMYNEAYEEWNQSQIQDNIKDAETGDKVNQATEGVVGAIFPWFAAANMASDLGTSFLGAEEINPNTGKKEFVENEGTRGWGSEAANVIKPVHEKVIDEIASEDTNWGKVAGDVLLPGIMPFMENAGLKTAYGGPRNPYACGGSKPMLPYKRAMGGPREDNTNVYRGATHEQGGIPIGYDYGGKVNPNKIEVENNEVSWINPNGGEEYIFSDRIEFKSGGKTKRKK